MQYKHIFFDLDHTLWDFERNSNLTFQQIFKEQQFSIDFDAFMNEYVPINFKYWRLFREEKVSKEELRYKRLKETFDALKYSVSDAVINQTAKDYLDYLPNYNHLIEGTIEVLNYLKPKYNLHIITNGFKEVQNKKIEASNIKQYFDVIVTSESVGVKKPNPKIFEFALKEANAKPEESIMVGDSFEADVLGSLAMKMQPIFYSEISKNELDTDKIITINSLNEILQYL